MTMASGRLSSLAVVAVGTVLLCANPLRAQALADGAALERRLAALSERLDELQREVAALRTLTGAEPAPAPAAPSAGTDSKDTGIEALEAELESLGQNLRILERKLEIEREAAVANVKAAPAIGAGQDGFQLKSADGSFQLRLRGLVQSDGRFFLDDYSQAAVDTFTARRVRPILDGTVYKLFDVRLMPDFGGGTTVLQDAYINMRFTPALKIQGGKFKSPFGLERLASASELLFLERGLPTAVAPNRDVGLMLHGDVRKGDVSYQVGVFDGVVDGGSTDLDDRDGKDVVGRLFVHPFRQGAADALKNIGIGVAASYGKQRGSATGPSLPTYRTTGQQTFFRYRSDGTVAGTTVADGTRYRWSAQGYWYVGRVGLLAEQVLSSQQVRRGGATAALRTNAWQLAGSWVLTGEQPSYRAVAPKRVFDRSAGKWGAFELTARLHQLTADDGAFPVFATLQSAARRARAWTGGLNWYLNRGVKLVLDYEQTDFDGGAVTGDRPTEHGVFTRMQFSF